MKEVLEAFITLFVIMDPIGNLPLVLNLVKGMPRREVKRTIERSILVAGLLLFIFLFLGLRIFDFFNINLNSFQVGGAIILLIIAILYVFGTPLKFVKSYGGDLTVPIGTPLLTGPGVIITTMILVREKGTIVTAIAAFLTLMATWFILINSWRLYKILGENWTNVISRIMGIILSAIAIEFITKGILNAVAQI